MDAQPIITALSGVRVSALGWTGLRGKLFTYPYTIRAAGRPMTPDLGESHNARVWTRHQRQNRRTLGTLTDRAGTSYLPRRH